MTPSNPLSNLPLMVIAWFAFLAFLAYLAALQSALNKCAPASRTMKPWKVWLTLIPIFGFVWHFIVVVNIAKSFRNEFGRVGVACPEGAPGQNIGIAAAICNCCIFLPLLGGLAAIIGVVLWIVYWKKIAGYSRTLEELRVTTPASTIA